MAKQQTAKQQLQTSIPGVGFIFRPKYTYKGELKESPRWMIRLRDGTQQRTGVTDQAQAYAELVKLAGRNAAGEMTNVRGTVGELFDLALDDATTRNHRSLYDLKSKIKILREAFGPIKIADFNAKSVGPWLNRNKIASKGQTSAPGKLADGSKVRYLAVIRRAFSLGMKAEPPLCSRVPTLPEFELDNAREGYLSPDEYVRLRDAFMEPHGRLFLVLAYHLGMRRGELLQLKWEQVDLTQKLLRLKGKQTKSKKPRAVPLIGETCEYLAAALSTKAPACEYVVQYEGRRVRDIKRCWATACRIAALPDLLKHDLRRTAITNLLATGLVSDTQAMDFSGHRTVAMIDRYNISKDANAIKLGERLRKQTEEQFQYKTLVQEKLDNRPN